MKGWLTNMQNQTTDYFISKLLNLFKPVIGCLNFLTVYL